MPLKKLFCSIVSIAMLLALCGCNNTTGVSTDQQILQNRRQAVVDEMHHMMTFLWSTDVDITYSKENFSKGLDKDRPNQIITLKAGRIYSGLPYTHGCGSAYDFQAFATEQDENGVYRISGMTWEALTGEDTFALNIRARVGNDCSEAVFWAWSKISSSINYKGTKDMTEDFGCIRVGNYNCDSNQLSYTIDVAAENGTTTMFASYAQLQPGDAVVYNHHGVGSHAMLVKEVYVAKDPADIPDYKNSYVTVIHQTSGNLIGEKYYYDEKLDENVYYCCRVDDKYSFPDLYKQGYLPVTCKELIDPAPLTEPTIIDTIKTPSFDNIINGSFSSPYAISYVTVTITDITGAQIQKCTAFATESELKDFQLFHLSDPQEVKVGFLDFESLKPGAYHCSHTCRLSTGDELTVRDFDFTVE